MERFPLELVYILIFLGIVLFNFLRQLAARRQQQEQAGEPQPVPELQAEPPEDELLEDVWGRRPAPAPAPAPAIVARPVPAPPLPAEAQPRRRLLPVRALLKTPQDLRRAMILAMVLGPCRAQEPPEER